jgi:ATP-dependent DNA ligase
METYESFIEKGYEGGMLKDTNAVYGKGWWKMKPVVEVDVVVMGFTKGKGKFEGQIGAIEFGVLDKNGKDTYLGRCSGMDDATRAELTACDEDLRGVPFEVKCQEVCRKKDWYSLRHPRFGRWREDLNRSDCNAEKLEREIK